MKSFLPSTRFFTTLAFAALASAAVFAWIGSYLHDEVGVQSSDTLRSTAMIAASAVFAVIAFCATPIMIRTFILMAAKAGIFSPSAPHAWRGLADRVSVAVWSLWLIGAAIAAFALLPPRP